MKFAKLIYAFIHPLKSLASKSAIISQRLALSENHRSLAILYDFAFQSLPEGNLAAFQNLYLTKFLIPFKDKSHADFFIIHPEEFIWMYKKSFWVLERNPHPFG